jgi:hypothetical protein
MYTAESLDKTHFMQFVTKNSSCNEYYNNLIILDTSTLKFLGILMLTLSWKSYIEMITPKLTI